MRGALIAPTGTSSPRPRFAQIDRRRAARRRPLAARLHRRGAGFHPGTLLHRGLLLPRTAESKSARKPQQEGRRRAGGRPNLEQEARGSAILLASGNFVGSVPPWKLPGPHPKTAVSCKSSPGSSANTPSCSRSDFAASLSTSASSCPRASACPPRSKRAGSAGSLGGEQDTADRHRPRAADHHCLQRTRRPAATAKYALRLVSRRYSPNGTSSSVPAAPRLHPRAPAAEEGRIARTAVDYGARKTAGGIASAKVAIGSRLSSRCSKTWRCGEPGGNHTPACWSVSSEARW